MGNLSLSNGQIKKSLPTKKEEPSLEELEAQFASLSDMIATKREAQQSKNVYIATNTMGRLKSLGIILFMLLVGGFLYEYIIQNDLSMKPIDLGGIQKVILSVILYFLGLMLTERTLKFFVPIVFHYLVNDFESEPDFSTHFKSLQPWQAVCVTCFFVGLFFWGFVQILMVKW